MTQEWEPERSIYVVGYSRLGQRIATTLERAYDWAYMEYDDDGVTQLLETPQEIESLGIAIDKMKNRGVTAFAICPAAQAVDFLDRLHAALAESTTAH